MESNELAIQYIVKVDGNQHDHERFREVVDDIPGAEIQKEADKAGYFEVDEDADD